MLSLKLVLTSLFSVHNVLPCEKMHFINWVPIKMKERLTQQPQDQKSLAQKKKKKKQDKSQRFVNTKETNISQQTTKETNK